MRYYRLYFILLCLCLYSNIYAQLSTNEQPVSFDQKLRLTEISRNADTIVTMPELDMKMIEAEDKDDEEYDIPPRFGYQHRVNYNLNNSGIWYELPNGDKLWKLEVICPAALSINFCYNKFWIPDGGKFFVYSKDRKHTIGAFTSKNNKGNRDNICGFATELVYGSDVVLEYYQPKEVATDAVISIEYIVHGYRFIRIRGDGFGESGFCMVNINCEEGQNWQNEKKAIAMIVVGGNRICTGSLLNTTDLSQKPYFLTANHCTSSYGNAIMNSNLYNSLFYWNYEGSGCLSPSVEPTNYHTTSGATIIANNSYPDFALLKLTEDPKTLSNYIPYYLGWDCSGLAGTPGVCIHHPSGDIKKISSVASQPISTYYGDSIEYTNGNHWKVNWKATQNGHGTSEGGSSGSPLLTNGHKVIGQLHGGYANCYGGINAATYFGKFSLSWTGNENTWPDKRLDCWLDSLNTGVQTMEGLLIIPTTSTMNSSQQLYSNIRITSSGQLTVQSNIELMGDCRVIVESGGKLIIDGGTMSNVDILLKPGGTLKIKNGGILETSNGFEAPAGAIVDIEYGQIL